jgi:hypothetical protein
MNKLRYLFKNITLLNVLLAAALAFMAHYTVLPLLNINTKYRLPTQKNIPADLKPAETERQIPSPSDYILISEQNLFHPERRIPPEKKEEAPLPKPDFVLYGTLIADTTSLAYIEDLKAPRNSAGRGRRQVALKKGDTLSGFTVKEIDTDKIVMVRGEEKMIVPVNDTQRSKTPPAAPTAAAAATPGRTAPNQQAAVVRPPLRSRRGSAALQSHFRQRQAGAPPQAPGAPGPFSPPAPEVGQSR